MIRGLLREGEFRLRRRPVQVGDWTLEPGEFELRSRAREGFAVLDGEGFVVALDTEITPELELEGEVRDLIRQMQEMRKDAGLEITDRIRLVHPERTACWACQHGAWIAAETLAVGAGARARRWRSRRVPACGYWSSAARVPGPPPRRRGARARPRRDALQPRRHESRAVPAGRARARAIATAGSMRWAAAVGRRRRHLRLRPAGGGGVGSQRSRSGAGTTRSSPACRSTTATAARAPTPSSPVGTIADETVEEITGETLRRR